MASISLSEGDYDFGGIFKPEECDYKLALLRKCLERVEIDLLSSRKCFDYVLSEIKEENDKIMKLLLWNQKRMELLTDIMNKNQVYVDKQNNLYKEINEFYKMKIKTDDVLKDKDCKMNK